MNKQVNTNSTRLIRIDSDMHKLLKMRATSEDRSIKELVEGILADSLSPLEKRQEERNL